LGDGGVGSEKLRTLPLCGKKKELSKRSDVLDAAQQEGGQAIMPAKPFRRRLSGRTTVGNMAKVKKHRETVWDGGEERAIALFGGLRHVYIWEKSLGGGG